MADIPSNIILANAFAKHLDGFSIGFNDLTQLMQGHDCDSLLVVHVIQRKNCAGLLSPYW